MPPSTTTPTPARRRVRTAVALGALTAATIGAALLPGGAASASTTTTAPVRTRAQIPWQRVGSGWTLATWSPSTSVNSTAKVSLLLVGGKGDRYLVARLSAGSFPVAFSPAGQQALVSTSSGRVADLDLHTGASHPISIPHLDTVLGYTAPEGTSLLTLIGVPRSDGSEDLRLERFGAGGRHELTYPGRDTKVGLLDNFDVQQTPDGAQLVVGGEHGLAVLRNTDGRVVRRLLPQKADCSAVSWWSKGVVLASCSEMLYTVPVDGAAAHQITRRNDQNPFGFRTAWQTGATTPRLGLAENGCGPASLVRFDKSGYGTRVTVPSPVGTSGTPSYIGHYKDTVEMIFNVHGGCQHTVDTLFSYDAAHNRSTTQVGGKLDGGTVIGAVPFPTDV